MVEIVNIETHGRASLYNNHARRHNGRIFLHNCLRSLLIMTCEMIFILAVTVVVILLLPVLMSLNSGTKKQQRMNANKFTCFG